MSGPVDELVDVQTLSEMFGLAESTFYAWRRDGRGPRSFKLGRRVVYVKSEVEAWLRAQQEATSRGGEL